MTWIWIDDSPDPNCKHENAYVVGKYTEECTSKGYYEIYCPKCDGRWDERMKHCKYTYPNK